MDTAQWPQEIVVKPIEEIVTNTCTKPIPNINNNNNNNSLERKLTRPQKDQQTLKNCPRCNSTNTKFCYYNNYSLTQPRYFCKTCRRYWTEGGSLRNIPVGGGSRKNKRPSSSSQSPSSTSSKIMVTKLPDLVNPNHPHNNNSNSNSKTIMMSQGQDLNLGFPNSSTNNTSGTSPSTTATHDFRHISDLVQLPNIDQNSNSGKSNPSNHISALELLTGFTSRGFNSFMPMPVIVPDHHHHHHHNPSSVYGPTVTSTSGFSLPLEFNPSLNFSLDGAGYGGIQESNNNGGPTNGRLLFPFEDLKQVSEGSNGIEQSNSKEQGDSTTGYWSGMLGGANW